MIYMQVNEWHILIWTVWKKSSEWYNLTNWTLNIHSLMMRLVKSVHRVTIVMQYCLDGCRFGWNIRILRLSSQTESLIQSAHRVARLASNLSHYEKCNHFQLATKRKRIFLQSPCLQTLNLRYTSLNERSVPILARALRTEPTLTCLHLENCALSGKSMLLLGMPILICFSRIVEFTSSFHRQQHVAPSSHILTIFAWKLLDRFKNANCVWMCKNCSKLLKHILASTNSI